MKVSMEVSVLKPVVTSRFGRHINEYHQIIIEFLTLRPLFTLIETGPALFIPVCRIVRPNAPDVKAINISVFSANFYFVTLTN